MSVIPFGHPASRLVFGPQTATPPAPPKGERASFFAPKTDWLARNEAVALALGKAQIAARVMDDQRIEVLSVRVSGDTAVLTLSRAPDQSSVHGATTLRACMGQGARGTALVGHGEHAVLVEWLL